MRNGPVRKGKTSPLVASSLFLSESLDGMADGAGFLNALSAADRARVDSEGRRIRLKPGESVFAQGEPHKGIFIIEEGRVRVFYTGPSGREVTLAYWTPGNFIGGPSIHRGGLHQWSGVAIGSVEATMLTSESLVKLMREIPEFSICLVDGLVSKAGCYTAMAQMLGTRSVIERLAQLLVNLAELQGTSVGHAVVIPNTMTHDEIAALVGATRQWVAMMLKRFREDGIVSLARGSLLILKLDQLKGIVQGL